MARYIVKLTDHDGTDWYLEWGSIVDAPVTNGMTREEFCIYYRDRYGRTGQLDLPGRMARVDRKDVSAWDYDSADHLLQGNRAGEDETELTREEILEHYCRAPRRKAPSATDDGCRSPVTDEEETGQ